MVEAELIKQANLLLPGGGVLLLAGWALYKHFTARDERALAAITQRNTEENRYLTQALREEREGNRLRDVETAKLRMEMAELHRWEARARGMDNIAHWLWHEMANLIQASYAGGWFDQREGKPRGNRMPKIKIDKLPAIEDAATWRPPGHTPPFVDEALDDRRRSTGSVSDYSGHAPTTGTSFDSSSSDGGSGGE